MILANRSRDSKFPLPKSELFWYDEKDNKSKPLVGKGGVMPVNNATQKIRDGFEYLNLDNWDIVKADGDIVELGGNTQGAGYLKISKGLDNEDSDTYLLSKFMTDSPVRMALGMSLSQRLMHQRFSFGIVGVDVNGNVVSEVTFASPINIASLSQASTTITIVTQTPHGYVPNDRINLSGVNDSRANFGEVYVGTVLSPTSFTVSATAVLALPSQTIATITNSGIVQKIDPFMGANNALGMFWEGAVASNVKMISRTGGGTPFYSVETSLGSNHTNATVLNANAYADSFAPTYLYDLRYKAEGVVVRTFPMDSINAQGGVMKRTQVIPEIVSGYKIRIRARNNKGMTKPVANIVNAVKTASTTATITTNVPHGLTVTDYVQVYGIRDQVGFPNITTATAVASVVNATTFTIAIGSSATVSSRGGTVIKVQGTFPISPSPISAQSVSVSGGLMTIIGSGTWTGFVHGETVELRGLVDSTTGTIYSALEGSYKVASISTTTLVLFAPLQPDQTLLNVGGAVIKRTDFRIHMYRSIDYTRHTVEIDGSVGNSTDNQEALAVNLTSGTVTTLSNGQTAHDAVATGSPFRIGAKAVNVNNPVVSLTADATDLVATMSGVLIQKPYSIPEMEWFYGGTAVTVNTDIALKTASGATLRNYLVGLQIKHTGTAPIEYVIKDGSTVIYRGHLSASMTTTETITFPIPLKTALNAVLNFQLITAPTSGSVYVNAQGHSAP